MTQFITDIEIKLYDPTSSAREGIATACVILRLKVALSVTFKVGSDTEMDFRSLTCLKHMEKIVGTISPDKFKQLQPAWIRLFSSLETFSSVAQKVAEVRRFSKSTTIVVINFISARFTSASCSRGHGFGNQGRRIHLLS